MYFYSRDTFMSGISSLKKSSSEMTVRNISTGTSTMASMRMPTVPSYLLEYMLIPFFYPSPFQRDRSRDFANLSISL